MLVVDDDEEAHVMMSVRLEKVGYEVKTAVDGRAAVDMLREDPNYALLVLDLFLTKMDGREVLQWVRDSVDTAALPVLIRTEADECLTKSMQPDHFLARVRAVLRCAAL